jgi:hypothetical protein
VAFVNSFVIMCISFGVCDLSFSAFFECFEHFLCMTQKVGIEFFFVLVLISMC